MGGCAKLNNGRLLDWNSAILCFIPLQKPMRAIMIDNRSPITKSPGIKIALGSSEQAPFIYFDGVATYGVNNGAIQMELAANTIMPEGTGTRT